MRSFIPARKFFCLTLSAILAALPSAALAEESSVPSAAAPYDFKNEGIFGCNQAAGATASAGTLAAIGGVYVPVNDAAVTLNTGILVYKECVLRPLQSRFREAATAANFKKLVVDIETGRDGNKRYVVNRAKERREIRDRSRLVSLTGSAAQAVTPSFKDAVVRWDARLYRQDTRSPESTLTCPYDDVDKRIRNESPDALGSIYMMTNPACIPHLDALMFKELADARDAQAVADWETCIEEGRGFYCVTNNAQDPLAEEILTPASVVQESFQEGFNAPQEQLNLVDDVGKLNGAVITSAAENALSELGGGLAGFTKSNGGRPSFLDQVTKESSQGVIGAAVNAALSILSAWRQIESAYFTAVNGTGSALTQTINQLRSVEKQCWDLVVPKAKDYASTNGFSLDQQKIQASIDAQIFSQQVIDSQITPLANAVLTNIQNSQRALKSIEQLIAGITNTSSITAQRLALQQLDTLVAQRQLHTQYDAENAAKDRDNVVAAMATLIDDTKKTWADSTNLNPPEGWCNINNTAVPKFWAERWKK